MSESTPALSLWESLLKELRNLLPADQYQMWFEDGLVDVEETDNQLTLFASSEFNAIWIESNYLDMIASQARSFLGSVVSVKVEFHPPSATEKEEQSSSEKTSRLSENVALEDSRSNNVRQNPRSRSKSVSASTLLDPRNTFENLVVGSGNELAHAASMAVANNPGRTYNPLFVFGETGLGKTHLMHAVAHQMLANNPNARIVYVSTEKFTNRYIDAILKKELVKFRQYYRTVDALLIDDIHFLSGKKKTQDEFFHTFNDLFHSGCQIFLASDRPANEIKCMENRLISRFQWGLQTDIQAPDFETRVAIFRKKATSMKLSLSDEIIEFLAEHVSQNVRRMEGALTRIASYHLIDKNIDISRMEHLLSDLLQEEEAPSKITVDQIQKKVAEYYKIGYSDLIGRRRISKIVFSRQVAMYISRKLTSDSLKSIGDTFGGRDHGTVIHACRQVENRMEQDATIKRAVDYLMNQLSRNH